MTRSVAPSDRLLRLQHNAYRTFAATDEYVWLYAERADVWNLPDVPAAERNVTPDFWKTIAKAREGAATHQPLDFDVRNVIVPAWNRLNQTAQQIVPRSAKIARIENAAPPQIDGKLDDAIYQQLTPLDGFSGFASTFDEAGKVQPTQSWV